MYIPTQTLSMRCAGPLRHTCTLGILGNHLLGSIEVDGDLVFFVGTSPVPGTWRCALDAPSGRTAPARCTRDWPPLRTGAYRPCHAETQIRSSMSGKSDNPPAYSSSEPKCTQSGDTRPLPDGWVKQWDNKYVFRPHIAAIVATFTWTHARTPLALRGFTPWMSRTKSISPPLDLRLALPRKARILSSRCLRHSHTCTNSPCTSSLCTSSHP